MGNFKEDVARCEAIVFDVDGVFTDGSITPLVNGDFIRTYNAKDGYAVAYAITQGLKICVISGGRGASLEYRMKMLGVKNLYIDCMDKIAAIRDFFEKEGVKAENTIYMGDDIPDLECMREVGIPVAPADAVMEVIEAARYVSEYGGGRGCARDIIEQVLRAKGKWAIHSRGVTGSKIPSR
ncbi:MAG: HAD hydrolase family protein [Rikenellaceae bacterium]